jgi:two-component system OmpR family response regulator
MPDIQILVVDDENDIRDVIAILLEKEGYTAVKASTGAEAVAITASQDFDLIIMDIIMPIMDGTQAAVEIRKHTQCPILFLTAKSSDEDKVQAYESGADDYLSKPFSRVELLLRVKALIKRYERHDEKSESIEIDRTMRAVIKNGKNIKLTDKEFELLDFLYSNRGIPFSIHDLYEQVWGEKYMQSSSNTVMVHILNLRKKLEDDFTNPKLILTAWGKGYCYAKEKA